MSSTLEARERQSLTEPAVLPRGRLVAIMGGLMLALLLAALDQTVVGTAMPRIIADLHGFDRYAWVVTSYMVASTSVVPIVGKLSDLYGRRPFFLGGIGLFLLASALCGASGDMTQLILFRGLQGIGAGVSMAMAMTVVGDLFPPIRRGRIQGLFASVWGLASVVGPPVGGYLTDQLSWRWVFYVNLPVGLVALAVLFFTAPSIGPRLRPTSIDYPGAAMLLLWVIPLLLALSWGGTQFAWESPQVLALLSLAVVGLVAFAACELRAPEPILPPALLANRTVLVVIVMAMLAHAGMFGVIFFNPLFVQGVIGATATESGAVLVPLMAGVIVASMVSGQMVSRTGRYRVLAIGGSAVIFLGILLQAMMDSRTGYSVVVRNMVVVGVGIGTLMPVLSVAAQNAVPASMLGVATSASQFFRSIGGTLGVAVFGSVLVSRFRPSVQAALPPEIAAGLPVDRLAGLDNPQALFSGQAGTALRENMVQAGLSAQGADVLLDAVRQGLATSLHEVFLLGVLVVGLGLLVSLLLPELSLRRGRSRLEDSQ